MIPRILIRRMSQSLITKLLRNAKTAEEKLTALRDKLNDIKRNKVEEKILQLTQENNILSTKVEKLKVELIRLEVLNGKKQYLFSGNITETIQDTNIKKVLPIATEKVKKNVIEKNKDKIGNHVQNSDSIVDVRKLDFRIGKIIDINKHPDADSLYVEKIDCGEGNPRTVVSGLVNHVQIDDMKDKIVIVLCNLKPVKMRGITSEAMVMCASSPEKVEVLIPPITAIPGDLVVCDGYPREPEVQLNPKKKIFETCAPDLKTNDAKVACYKGSPLVVIGKGPIVAPTLPGVPVK